MAIFDDKWFEVCYYEGEDIVPYYLLVVATNVENRSEILVTDPCRNHAIEFRSTDYEEVRNWLLEDERQQVMGREFPDDGWPRSTPDK
jgi:hypothetical protein